MLTSLIERFQQQVTRQLALLALIGIQAEVNGEDIQAWLEKAASQQAQHPALPSPQFPIPFDDAGLDDSDNSLKAYSDAIAGSEITDNAIGNKHRRPQSQRHITKVKEQRTLRRLSERLRINLFNSDRLQRRHRWYINGAKQELVGKSRIGKARYELRVSEDQAEAHFRYQLN